MKLKKIRDGYSAYCCMAHTILRVVLNIQTPKVYFLISNVIVANSIASMNEIRHCSECKYYWCYPHTTQMYCYKLGRRITARKKYCKHYKPNK